MKMRSCLSCSAFSHVLSTSSYRSEEQSAPWRSHESSLQTVASFLTTQTKPEGSACSDFRPRRTLVLNADLTDDRRLQHHRFGFHRYGDIPKDISTSAYTHPIGARWSCRWPLSQACAVDPNLRPDPAPGQHGDPSALSGTANSQTLLDRASRVSFNSPELSSADSGLSTRCPQKCQSEV